MVSVLRPGQRILRIPGFGVTTSRRAVQSAAADWWAVTGKTCVGAYQAKGAADLASSYVNLSSPGTYDAGVGNAPGWATETGWQFTAASAQYLITSFIPALDQSQTVLVQYSDCDLASYTMLIGSWTGSGSDGRYWIAPKWSTSPCIDNGSDFFGGTTSASGNLGFAGDTGYQDGVALAGTIPAGSVASSFPFYIGCMNNNGSASGYITAHIQAFVIYSDTLTAGEVATVSAAMAAL